MLGDFSPNLNIAKKIFYWFRLAIAVFIFLKKIPLTHRFFYFSWEASCLLGRHETWNMKHDSSSFSNKILHRFKSTVNWFKERKFNLLSNAIIFLSDPSLLLLTPSNEKANTFHRCKFFASLQIVNTSHRRKTKWKWILIMDMQWSVVKITTMSFFSLTWLRKISSGKKWQKFSQQVKILSDKICLTTLFILQQFSPRWILMYIQFSEERD